MRKEDKLKCVSNHIAILEKKKKAKQSGDRGYRVLCNYEYDALIDCLKILSREQMMVKRSLGIATKNRKNMKWLLKQVEKKKMWVVD